MGERKREIDPGDRPESSRSVGALGRRRVTLAKMNSARERALPAACEGAEVGTVPLTPISSVRARFIRCQSSGRRPINAISCR